MRWSNPDSRIAQAGSDAQRFNTEPERDVRKKRKNQGSGRGCGLTFASEYRARRTECRVSRPDFFGLGDGAGSYSGCEKNLSRVVVMGCGEIKIGFSFFVRRPKVSR